MITWYASDKKDGNYVQIAVSKSPLYVTYNKPIPRAVIDSLPFYQYVFHTAIYYGCKSANGLNDSVKIVEAIYQKTFIETQQKVKRIDSPKKEAMQYWGDELRPNLALYQGSTEELLYFEDSNCQQWTEFFARIIITQGISKPSLATVSVLWDNLNYGNNLPVKQKTELISSFTNIFGLSATYEPIRGSALESVFFVNNWNFNQANMV